MRSLREMQRGFAAALVEMDDRVATLIGAARGHGARRISVYRNNINTTLTETLGAIYPVVRRLVGDDFFQYCARNYVRQHPSNSGDLNNYGADFALFVADFEPARGLLYLADVARLEWAYHTAFHAADHVPLRTGRIAALAPEQYDALRFALHPSARLLTSPYPVITIWKMNQDDADPNASVALDEGGDTLLVIRPELDIEFIRLEAAAYQFLSAIAGGGAFAAACEAAIASNPDFRMNDFFAFCVSHGIIVDFTVPEQPT